jgi:hypothetical protein
MMCGYKPVAMTAKHNSVPTGSCLGRSCSGTDTEATNYPQDSTDAWHNGNSRCCQHEESLAIPGDQTHCLAKNHPCAVSFV